MRNLILVVLLLQLLLTLKEANGHKFGDLISFKRKCSTYKHFAVYVGNMDFPGKQPGQDIFHHIAEPKPNGTCGFGVLKDTGKGDKNNYLDKCVKGKKFTPDRAQMIERIKYWNNPANCGKYNLCKNNCEHLATHVRYGIKKLRQPGTVAGALFIWTNKCKKLLKKMEENQEPEGDSSCTT